MNDNGIGLALGLLEAAPDEATARQQWETAEQRGADWLELARSWAAWRRNNGIQIIGGTQ